jgi:hypothetical protein
MCVDQTDNELSCLEAIHLFVEVLDAYFGNVCELDLVFNFFKVRCWCWWEKYWIVFALLEFLSLAKSVKTHLTITTRKQCNILLVWEGKESMERVRRGHREGVESAVRVQGES